jgi:hypothetical protein
MRVSQYRGSSGCPGDAHSYDKNEKLVHGEPCRGTWTKGQARLSSQPCIWFRHQVSWRLI